MRSTTNPKLACAQVEWGFEVCNEILVFRTTRFLESELLVLGLLFDPTTFKILRQK
jgi:hypothetical protein